MQRLGIPSIDPRTGATAIDNIIATAGGVGFTAWFVLGVLVKILDRLRTAKDPLGELKRLRELGSNDDPSDLA